MTILTKNHEQLTAVVARHIAADSVAQGSYRTCFIGCLALKRNDPQYIQDTYGIPVMLTRILEDMFENLPAQDAPKLFAALPAAVGHDGKDLTKVSWKFLVEVIKKLPQQPQKIRAVIDPVISGLSLLAEGKEWNKDDAGRAALAANAVAWSYVYCGTAAGAVAGLAAKAAALAVQAAWSYCAPGPVSVAARAADAGVSVEWQRDLILRLIAEA
jgi:hypothetical protein